MAEGMFVDCWSILSPRRPRVLSLPALLQAVLTRFDEAIIGRTSDTIYPKFAVKLLWYACFQRATVCGKARKMRAYRHMKIALKYGILVALVIAGWVALKNFVLHLEGPAAPIADTVIFNLAAIVGIALGIREKRVANGGVISFGDGFKTGVSIAIAYALLTCLYFGILIALTGPKMMQQAGHTSYVSAFAGLAIGLVLFGAVFSAIIAAIMKKSG